jgi:integrase/recombinase XerD
MPTKKNYLTGQEIETLYNAMNSDRDRLMHKVLQFTGRRITEALNLKPEDIDHENKMISFIQLKKKVKTIIPVDCSAFYEQLMKYIRENEIKPEEFVFFSPYKGRDYHITKRWIEAIYVKHGTECGIKVTPHFLRHSFIIQLLNYLTGELNIDRLDALVTAKEKVGHARLDTTLSYLPYLAEEVGLSDMWKAKKGVKK